MAVNFLPTYNLITSSHIDYMTSNYCRIEVQNQPHMTTAVGLFVTDWLTDLLTLSILRSTTVQQYDNVETYLICMMQDQLFVWPRPAKSYCCDVDLHNSGTITWQRRWMGRRWHHSGRGFHWSACWWSSPDTLLDSVQVGQPETYRVAQKIWHTFCTFYNFIKCWPIFKRFALSESGEHL